MFKGTAPAQNHNGLTLACPTFQVPSLSDATLILFSVQLRCCAAEYLQGTAQSSVLLFPFPHCMWFLSPGEALLEQPSLVMGVMGLEMKSAVPVSPRDWRWDNQSCLMAASSWLGPGLGKCCLLPSFPSILAGEEDLEVQGAQPVHLALLRSWS